MKVWRVKGMSNSYITDDGFVIDAGADQSSILKVAYENSISVKYIMLTHSHVDHVKYLRSIKDTFGCRVVAPELEITSIEGRKEGKMKVKESLIPSIARTIMKGQTAKVDVAVSEGEFEGFTVIHLPGHTPGSIAYLRDGVLFSGDALIEKSGELSLPPSVFTVNMDQARASVMKLERYKIKEIYPGHGNQVEGEKLPEFLETIREKK
ncbi:MBL fold metallo-hydrolase [Sulfuracidifex tepidarius]|uniref:Hydroxyacylglutathione hydrolase n=1 Tax=Sulfuracidifex tepidarius TaxID=1294262 RepID=A0A510DX57_9CREN|nr:MBL fold metallo-hydrolase [Sulfuracidifex tepidarius]BBG24802.1 Hydroxyacylglutathione hydrolase [Sulfuracidifex tepidarius]BBG27587.1 Hydroxyacylglutathione hydrolase [Sulfuracidifex tepidarius]